MILYKYYNKLEYPLEEFSSLNIPYRMGETLIYLMSNQIPFILRGGMALAYLVSDFTCDLKDCDIMINRRYREQLNHDLELYSDVTFFNKNMLGKDVLTLFWRANSGFHKLDILFMEELQLGSFKAILINGSYYTVSVIDLVWLWVEKLKKVAEAQERKATLEKTDKHAQIVLRLGKKLLENDIKSGFWPIIKEVTILDGYLKKALDYLSKNHKEFNHEYFYQIVTYVINHWRKSLNENIDLSTSYPRRYNQDFSIN
ncbi:Uncharacterized protein dnl_20940 [Desulfonema limicola]|uniref:Uncharacterized protein n=1 Tax=Desulfonema limicola TaxID=45656 RepID=A0A975GG23_9BACT|nr:hypothetical protein [Desulfonema limicola]QTA79812.1 Uncharacterized protein dnl_20940 [Desulfonema limicola]